MTATGTGISSARLADALHAALPQTQCTRCGYPDCHGYAEAMARGEAQINQCPPGGAQGIVRLARLTGRPALPLNPVNGTEGPRALAIIDEDWCIGCTLCIKACPVDCIAMVAVTGERSGWDAWSPAQAAEARERYASHCERVEREARENEARLEAAAERKLADLAGASSITDPAELERKRAMIEAVIGRSRARRDGGADA